MFKDFLLKCCHLKRLHLHDEENNLRTITHRDNFIYYKLQTYTMTVNNKVYPTYGQGNITTKGWSCDKIPT